MFGGYGNPMGGGGFGGYQGMGGMFGGNPYGGYGGQANTVTASSQPSPRFPSPNIRETGAPGGYNLFGQVPGQGFGGAQTVTNLTYQPQQQQGQLVPRAPMQGPFTVTSNLPPAPTRATDAQPPTAGGPGPVPSDAAQRLIGAPTEPPPGLPSGPIPVPNLVPSGPGGLQAAGGPPPPPGPVEVAMEMQRRMVQQQAAAQAQAEEVKRRFSTEDPAVVAAAGGPPVGGPLPPQPPQLAQQPPPDTQAKDRVQYLEGLCRALRQDVKWYQDETARLDREKTQATQAQQKAAELARDFQQQLEQRTARIGELEAAVKSATANSGNPNQAAAAAELAAAKVQIEQFQRNAKVAQTHEAELVTKYNQSQVELGKVQEALKQQSKGAAGSSSGSSDKQQVEQKLVYAEQQLATERANVKKLVAELQTSSQSLKAAKEENDALKKNQNTAPHAAENKQAEHWKRVTELEEQVKAEQQKVTTTTTQLNEKDKMLQQLKKDLADANQNLKAANEKSKGDSPSKNNKQQQADLEKKLKASQAENATLTSELAQLKKKLDQQTSSPTKADRKSPSPLSKEEVVKDGSSAAGGGGAATPSQSQSPSRGGKSKWVQKADSPTPSPTPPAAADGKDQEEIASLKKQVEAQKAEIAALTKASSDRKTELKSAVQDVSAVAAAASTDNEKLQNRVRELERQAIDAQLGEAEASQKTKKALLAEQQAFVESLEKIKDELPRNARRCHKVVEGIIKERTEETKRLERRLDGSSEEVEAIQKKKEAVVGKEPTLNPSAPTPTSSSSSKGKKGKGGGSESPKSGSRGGTPTAF